MSEGYLALSQCVLKDVQPRNMYENYETCTILQAFVFCTVYRGGSRISGKGVHMHKGVGFAMLILYHFS